MPTPREAYTNTVQRQGNSGERLHAADFGSAGELIGRAAQGFGQDLMQTSNNLDKIAEEDAKLAAQEADNVRTANRLKRYYGDPDDGTPGFFNQQGKNALLDAKTLQPDISKIDADAAEMLKGKPRALKMFNELTMRRNMDDMAKISQHVNTEREKYTESVDADALDLAIDNASNSLDPKVVDENIATAGNIVVRQAMRKGMTDPNQLVQARQAGVGKAVAAIAKQLNLQSPSEAQAFVAHKAGEMDPDDVASLLETLEGPAAKERASEDVGSFIVTKGAPVDAQPAVDGTPAPPTPHPDDAALDAAQWSQESKGHHYGPDGGLVRSPAGALGISQTMPDTGVDPGYGVKPLQNQSREEYMRFGRDYRHALTKHYGGDIVLGLTAYNWGPKNVDEHIKAVGDPSKGQISDAAFLNSIPNKEARDYAALVLGRVGVSPTGVPTRPSQTLINNEEIDLDATFAKIDASDRTYRDKEALKSEVKERYSLGRSAKAARTEDLKDQAAGFLNTLKDPNDFTSYDQLPLELRQQIAKDPSLEQAYRGMAATNKAQVEARAAANDAKAKTEAARVADFDVASQAYANPQAFARINFMDPKQVPGLSLEDRQKWMGVKDRMSKSDEGSAKYANFSEMRTVINRFAGKTPPADIGVAFDEATRREQQWLDVNPGKQIPDAVREGIAREIMTRHVVVTKGSLYGETKKSVYGYQLPGEKAKAGTRYSRQEVDSFEVVKAQLQQIWKRTPTDAEVQAEIQHRTTSSGLRL